MPTAIVTGASRGLGLALADALAERGWRLVIDGRDGVALEQAAARLRGRTEVVAIPGDVADAWHRPALVEAAGAPDRAARQQRLVARSPLPCRRCPAIPSTSSSRSTARTRSLPSRSRSSSCRGWPRAARIVNVTSDAAVEAYEGWGGYGSSKAALEQLSAVLAAEHPELRIYAVDPGDMNTRMQQDAFPGEDVSDRPPPEASVPGLLTLIEGDLPSGRYAARALAEARA